MKRCAHVAVVGVWLVLMAAAGGAGAQVEPKSDPNDVYWSDQFDGAGMDDAVFAFAMGGSGNVYAGGVFTTAGGSVPANYIAKWDGAAWSALGTGMGGGYPWPLLAALAVDGSGNVYAGGRFTVAGGVAANCIAKWDGAAWSPLGTGMDDSVVTLAMDSSGNVYAGGGFTTAGGVTVNHIAKWNGAAWSALGTGMSDHVEDLAVDGSGNVYAGGNFTTAGGMAANSIAKWDGTAWSTLGTGMNNEVMALAVNRWGNLYVGGFFTTAGDKVSGYIALWQPFAEEDEPPPGCFGG